MGTAGEQRRTGVCLLDTRIGFFLQEWVIHDWLGLAVGAQRSRDFRWRIQLLIISESHCTPTNVIWEVKRISFLVCFKELGRRRLPQDPGVDSLVLVSPMVQLLLDLV